jgi:adenylate cyclase
MHEKGYQMAIEIERKFRVHSHDYRAQAQDHQRIVQGYLQSDPARTVRVRIRGDRGYLTIKGISDAGGTSRFEWEQCISIEDAESLLALCESGIIDKVRYRVPVGGHLFEVDEFAGDNTGLIVAEIELANADEIFQRPDWLAEEVTGDARYYNSALKAFPYTKWRDNHGDHNRGN